MAYDETEDVYWLCYDWCDNNFTWENAHKCNEGYSDSGAALAWSKSPEGPFTRLKKPFFSNREQYGKLGLFTRGYASTVLKRNNDWIAFILLDSGPCFSWGLACMTAETPFGPWSEPRVLLSSSRPEYYPAPVEFHPCFAHENKVYAPATSVSKNRNYQAVFVSDLEQAHLPSSWSQEFDGGVWHSRNLADEKYGVWGQTIHGFIKSNELTVMYPARDEREFGTLSVAKRLWDEPFSDGFTFSGHAGKSISPLLAAYKEFTLFTEFNLSGTVEIAFDYAGILGPDCHCSDASPHEQSLSSYYAMVLSEAGTYKFIKKENETREILLIEGSAIEKIKNITIEKREEYVHIYINGEKAGQAEINTVNSNPIALIAHEFSIFNCSKFEVDGDVYPNTLKFNSLEGILNAGQLMKNWKRDELLDFKSREHLTGEGNVKAKWNFIGDSCYIYSPKSPKLGIMEIWVDGYLVGTASLHSEQDEPSQIVYGFNALQCGRHCVEIKPHEGIIAADILEVCGTERCCEN